MSVDGVVVMCVQGRPYTCGLAQRGGARGCYCAKPEHVGFWGACCPSLGGSVSAPRVPSWRGRPPSRWACSSTRRRLCSLPRCLPCWPCVRDPLSEMFVVAACAGKARVRSGVRAGVRSVPWVGGVRARWHPSVRDGGTGQVTFRRSYWCVKLLSWEAGRLARPVAAARG